MISEDQLQATGLRERVLDTYRAVGSLDPPLIDREQVAKRLGVAPSTVIRHLSLVRRKLTDAGSLEPPTVKGEALLLEVEDPPRHAAALSKLSEPAPFRNVERVAKELGLNPATAQRLVRELDSELQPLKREITEIRLEDLTKRFGTLARDAIDAITPEKLLKANAQQLAVISGIATEKWQLLLGQPTQRMEISDRRKLNELVTIILNEAKRRNIEIDVTPDGQVTAKKSPYRSARHQRATKQIASGDPAETLAPA